MSGSSILELLSSINLVSAGLRGRLRIGTGGSIGNPKRGAGDRGCGEGLWYRGAGSVLGKPGDLHKLPEVSCSISWHNENTFV